MILAIADCFQLNSTLAFSRVTDHRHLGTRFDGRRRQSLE